MSSGATIPSASLWENLGFNLGTVIPIALQGTFTRRRFWVTLWGKILSDPGSVRRIHRMRRKYASDYLFVRLGTTRTLLVLDPDGIGRVLDRSPDVYGPPAPKREGMAHFQPDAVTVSVDGAWQERRRFNAEVLDASESPHHMGQGFLRVVREEINARPPRTWDDFDRLFARITRRVIFGSAARDDTTVTDLLRTLMRESNSSRGRKRQSASFEPFYDRIRHYLEAAEPGSLAALSGEVPSGPETRVAGQIPHWMFAMWETLGTNTARALALIVAHPEASARVRAELAGGDVTTARGVERLAYLGGCLQEAMRLWPTTPMLLRETLAGDTLGDAPIPAGTQVLILNSFNHRDRDRVAHPDTFAPESWADGSPSPLFNHLSNGPQDCVGRHLAVFLGKAVLATLLDRFDYRLLRPRLDPGKPLPYSYNYFKLRFEAEPRATGG